MWAIHEIVTFYLDFQDIIREEPKVDTEPYYGFPSIDTTNPIRIAKIFELKFIDKGKNDS